jgi:hypothetical protein
MQDRDRPFAVLTGVIVALAVSWFAWGVLKAWVAGVFP